MAESAPNLDELRQVGLFGAVNDEALEFLAAKLVVLQPAPGDVVFHEGDAARDMFVVMNGEMEVLKRSHHGVEARVARARRHRPVAQVHHVVTDHRGRRNGGAPSRRAAS